MSEHSVPLPPRYGKQYIPIEDINDEDMKYSPGIKTLQLLGFTDAAALRRDHRYLFLKDPQVGVEGGGVEGGRVLKTTLRGHRFKSIVWHMHSHGYEIMYPSAWEGRHSCPCLQVLLPEQDKPAMVAMSALVQAMHLKGKAASKDWVGQQRRRNRRGDLAGPWGVADESAQGRPVVSTNMFP